jgi:hypothetical protein
MGGPPGNDMGWDLRRTCQYIARFETRGRPEGLPDPRLQQVGSCIMRANYDTVRMPKSSSALSVRAAATCQDWAAEISPSATLAFLAGVPVVFLQRYDTVSRSHGPPNLLPLQSTYPLQWGLLCHTEGPPLFGLP